MGAGLRPRVLSWRFRPAPRPAEPREPASQPWPSDACRPARPRAGGGRWGRPPPTSSFSVLFTLATAPPSILRQSGVIPDTCLAQHIQTASRPVPLAPPSTDTENLTAHSTGPSPRHFSPPPHTHTCPLPRPLHAPHSSSKNNAFKTQAGPLSAGLRTLQRPPFYRGQGHTVKDDSSGAIHAAPAAATRPFLSLPVALPSGPCHLPFPSPGTLFPQLPA